MSLRIRTIARLTGIREATLRAWERRHGFPRPERSENNYRVYSRDEVEAVRRVAKWMEEGLSVSEAIAQVRDEPRTDVPPEARHLERFWAAVMVLDSEGADAALSAAQVGLDAATYCDTVLLPLLREMASRLDVAREHMASALRGAGGAAWMRCPLGGRPRRPGACGRLRMPGREALQSRGRLDADGGLKPLCLIHRWAGAPGSGRGYRRGSFRRWRGGWWES
ncbi:MULTISPECIES: MerR family transcriptional regulator [unclassified Corallococcus]|uniref:MerR family transcriptional regulator n=1 Tax=unclassified Corallococcus TaxID=2685029 RepID=UPI001F5D2528|nr:MULTISPECIES: MerR family transcriptional regulator [unclassified Corallococcus]WAS87780.1 MerR family transcriptional regulator [Corallococcus sp. NCRR]